jgi:hypothetical protein
MSLTRDERAVVARIASTVRETVLANAVAEGHIIRVEPELKGTEAGATEAEPRRKGPSSRARVADEFVTGPAAVALSCSKFVTTAEAARELSTNEHALREKIRRTARRIGGRYVADLGVIAFHKFGRSWRGRWAV